MEQMLERQRGILLFGFVLVAIVGIVLYQVLRPGPEPIILSTATPMPSPQATSTPRPLRVYVSGAVLQPDVYALSVDSIVKDAVMAAGGPADDADLDRINLALPLADGQHVYVPRQGEEDPPVEPPGRAPRRIDYPLPAWSCSLPRSRQEGSSQPGCQMQLCSASPVGRTRWATPKASLSEHGEQETMKMNGGMGARPVIQSLLPHRL